MKIRKSMTKFRIRMIAFAIAFGVILAAACMILAVPAKANTIARVEVFWTGTECIDIDVVGVGIRTKCGGYAGFVNSDTGPGWVTGVDPIMGAADTVSCTFYLNGRIEYVDFAVAGDGTDVNCIREIYNRPIQNGMYT